MKNYFEYLQKLSKDELIKIIYDKNDKKAGNYPYKSKRRIALRLSYNGKNYKGLQSHAFIKSIEGEIMRSLNATGIGESPVFCGRTDAGVSAISMVVSLDVKSRIENPNRNFEIVEDDYNEYPYDKIINERLPLDIRITGWAPAPDEFNARHWCIQRYYKYYFLKKNLNIELVREGCEKIKKMCNFYKLSTHSNPRAVYDKKIDEINIELVEKSKEKNTDYDDLYCLNIKSGSFLHNMVRKIVWLIQSYGNGNPFVLEQVRIAPPYPLIFVSGKYKEKINFIGNRFSKPIFEIEWDNARIENIIAEFKFKNYEK